MSNTHILIGHVTIRTELKPEYDRIEEALELIEDLRIITCKHNLEYSITARQITTLYDALHSGMKCLKLASK